MAGGIIGGLGISLIEAARKSKEEKRKAAKPKKESAIANGWKCPKCGKVNSNMLSICECGYEEQ